MPITFAPRRGALLMCDFDMACVSPEMAKVRRVVVVSPNHLNHRHGRAPGLCLVVPFSATPPATPGPHDVFFPAGVYRSLTVDVWAKCAAVTLVSHDRLDRVGVRRGVYLREMLSPADMARIEAGLRAALGLPAP